MMGILDPILFYKPRDEYGCFSNFSLSHDCPTRSVDLVRSRAYPTGEHRYQALKSDDQEGHEYVIESRIIQARHNDAGDKSPYAKDGAKTV
jgi:predicted NAD-dependent protein-ADP-ribosyltransferase YbiA (DUF1768 family)